MSLSLKVPALSEKPIFIAETRPHKISEFLNNLPKADLLATAHGLFDSMEAINRQKVGSADRVRAMEIYRIKVHEISDALTAEYFDAPLPLPEVARSFASVAESLWLELSYGYKLALIDSQKKLFNLGNGVAEAHMIQRALDAIRQQALVYHYTYVPLPASIWGEINRLYLYAVQESLQEVEIEANLYQSVNIHDTYVQIALMALSNPQCLTCLEIKRTALYIEKFGQLAKLLPWTFLSKSAGAFLVKLHSEDSPVALGKNPQADNKSDLLLTTLHLAKQVYQHLQQIKAKAPDIDASLPAYAYDAEFSDLLRYLLRQWGEKPKRYFERKRRNNTIELAVGLEAGHDLFYIEKSATTATEEAISALGTVNKWVIVNMSASGLALRKPPLVQEQLRVGSLLCLRENKKHWSIAVVRWAANNLEQQIDIGTQLLAPTAKPISLHILGQEPGSKALLLPSVSVLKQTSSIIANHGTFTQGASLEIDDGVNITRVVMTELLARTSSYDQFKFNELS
jgi:cyclic-di-GMP-binding protein